MDDPPDAATDIRDAMARSEFHRWAGMELLRIEAGEAHVALDATPHHLNLRGSLHGGMIAAVADTATGLAIRSMLEPGRAHATVQLDIHFLAPGSAGRIVALGRTVRVGRRLGYAEADVVDEAGTLLARATATHAIGSAEEGPEG
jgi:uncharacterized protein (TIGR00369 family)